MRLAFAGTPAFAAAALQAIVAAGHEVGCVLTQPDRAAGRGLRLQASAVKVLASKHGLPVWQPAGLRLDGRFAADARAAQAALQTAAPEVLVVAAYGLLLPSWLLELPRRGCLNIHASLLPRWRGAAPIQRAIEAGDPNTGVTIMQMDAGLDTGGLLAMAQTPIGVDDTAATLHDRLAELGGRLLVDTLAQLMHGAIIPRAQDDAHATYAAKLNKEEARLDWNADALVLARRIRAFNPWPVAHTALNGQTLRLWHAQAEHGTAPEQPPGTVLTAAADGVRVQCATGVLRITRLQLEGGKVLDARAFLNGRPLPPGTRLGP